ncbi:MAG: hypothetical protein IKQ63_07470 [Eubacterium sp.]|nr:hypothetical protein [Eubacterium sp.]
MKGSDVTAGIKLLRFAAGEKKGSNVTAVSKRTVKIYAYKMLKNRRNIKNEEDIQG